MDIFRHNLKASLSVINVTQDLDSLVNSYDAALRSVLDSQAPIQTKSVVLKNKNPWYDNELKAAKQARRRYERAYHKSPNADNQQSLKGAVHKANKLLRKKEDYYTSVISTNSGNQKQLFKIVKEIANTQSSVPYPEATNNKADNFSTYFKDKIDRIYADLEFSAPVQPDPISSEAYTSSEFTEFTPLTCDQLRKIYLSLSVENMLVGPTTYSATKRVFE